MRPLVGLRVLTLIRDPQGGCCQLRVSQRVALRVVGPWIRPAVPGPG